MTHCYVFSYGSNLLLERIRARTPSVEVVQPFQLFGHQLVFNKASQDGSTKANLVPSEEADHSVWGVIQRICLTEKPELDRVEGLGFGYDLHSFQHPSIDVSVQFYISRDSQYQKEGNPYDWYLNYVIQGAIENGFPAAYINKLYQIAFDVDPDVSRRAPHDWVLRMNKAEVLHKPVGT